MKSRICFAYPWATFGGCERVFINRAMAFKAYYPKLKIDFFFTSDGGGLKNFNAALKKYGLQDTANVVTSLDATYEIISLVDCPQLFSKINFSNQRVIIECHTGYAENRRYLSSLPPECRVIATPSSRFSELIRHENPSLSALVTELANFVPWDIKEHHSGESIFLPNWRRKPILFFGRMDRLKNPGALLDALQVIENRRPGEFMIIFCGPKSSEIDIEKEIFRRRLGELTITLPPMPFHSAFSLMDSVRRSGGVFVSPSREESFGLSAAEAISALLPPALSDIGAHLDLVGDAQDLFTFQLDSTSSLASRIEKLLDNPPNVENTLRKLRDNLSAKNFTRDWEAMLTKLNG